MKTQTNKKLFFTKESIIELNDNKLQGINGGGTGNGGTGDGGDTTTNTTEATFPTVHDFTTALCKPKKDDPYRG